MPPLSIPLEPSITIFVGPNNAGKSQLLREISGYCTQGSSHRLILDKVSFAAVDEVTAKTDLNGIKRIPSVGEGVHGDQVPVLLGGRNEYLHASHYLMGRQKPNEHPNFFAKYHLADKTIVLDAKQRTSLLDSQGQGDLTRPHHPMAKLFRNDDKRVAWRNTVYDAVGLYPAITALQQGQLSVHFGASAPPDERTLREDIVEWVDSARSVGDVSDGVKAFSGILMQAHGGDPKVIFVDEPEAFLHPSIARRLGKELASAARSEGKYVFVATHSADFLMGAIQSGAIVNIVRLTYTNNVATARLLRNQDLKIFMSDPMLRSVGVLSGLFFESVIVTEGDTDRAFYQEANERLLDEGDLRGVPHALFLNAGGHASIPSIIAPLRQLGIPAASVVDLDILKNGQNGWTKQITSCQLPEPQRAGLSNQRQIVLDALVGAAPQGTEKPREYFKRYGGVALLDKQHHAVASDMFDILDRYGLFVVRSGEVEAWLKHLCVPSKKDAWR
ncbi:MAG: ATP-dependent endonuclease, partial [Hyphomicrobiaceae bacterium]